MAVAEAEIRAACAHGAQVRMIGCDLAILSDAARLAKQITELTQSVDVLLNNAGGVRGTLAVTPEGNEATFAGNHLGHFVLTNRLLPSMRRAAAESAPGTVRVVSVSSSAHAACPGIDWSDLQQLREWTSGKSYCQAKLCNLLFSNELARRVAADGIVANAMHPGIVASNFANHADAGMKAYLATCESRSPDAGADTLVWLATAEEGGRVSGAYFHDRKAATPAPVALDVAAAARLWTESEALLRGAGIEISG